MELRDRLKPYCDALVKGMEAENWYLSLIAALTLPDICTSLEDVSCYKDGESELFINGNGHFKHVYNVSHRCF